MSQRKATTLLSDNGLQLPPSRGKLQLLHQSILFNNRHPQFGAELAASRDARKVLLSQLTSASNRDRRRRLLSRYFRNAKVALAYVFDALKDRKQLGDHTPQSIHELASLIDPFHRSGQPVERRTLQKGSKSPRATFSFGPIDKATQAMVSDAIRALHPSREFQFTFRGVPSALAEVSNAVARGYVFGLEVDVVGFYPHVTLPSLHMALRYLPRTVTESTVWTGLPSQSGQECSYSSNANGPGFRGSFELAQGSVCSAAAGEALLGMILANLSPSVVVVNYADNIYLLARTMAAVFSARQHLAVLLGDLPGGPLEIADKCEAHDLRKGFSTFLGCEASWDASAGQLIWQPTDLARGKIEFEVDSLFSTPDTMRRAVGRVYSYYDCCRNWPEKANWAFVHLAELEAKSVLITGGCVQQSARRIFRFWQKTEGLVPLGFLLPPPPLPGSIERGRFEQLVSQLCSLSQRA
ncbi:hypothetical protein [Devosia neptuniae]|uniref:hypothetical protein n=1 Tax=Devosia neptuniae TaxID=191302 RepID=UPI0022B0071D|nr:hypothetical protein [Devosia neptuniae]MCZ4346448.1 hypothetical protein [Devosia neptuniae]